MVQRIRNIMTLPGLYVSEVLKFVNNKKKNARIFSYYLLIIALIMKQDLEKLMKSN